MMRKLIFLALIFCFIVPLSAQVKVVSFQKLQQFLPAKEIKGFKRNKPVDETQTVSGISISQASVTYEKIQKINEAGFTPASYKFTIQDASVFPEMLEQYATFVKGYENETEVGYEKGIMLKGKYPAKLSGSSPDDKNCRIETGIGKRFLVSAECDGGEGAKFLESMLSTIDFNKLLLVKADK